MNVFTNLLLYLSSLMFLSDPYTLQVVPQQNNGCDCGVFTAEFATRIIDKFSSLMKISAGTSNNSKLFLAAFEKNVLRSDSFDQTFISCVRGNVYATVQGIAEQQSGTVTSMKGVGGESKRPRLESDNTTISTIASDQKKRSVNSMKGLGGKECKRLRLNSDKATTSISELQRGSVMSQKVLGGESKQPEFESGKT